VHSSAKLRSSTGRERLAHVLRQAKGLVTVDDAAAALGLDRTSAAKLLARWAEQGWLKRLRRGVYGPIPVDALSSERTLVNPWVIVPQLFSPGYVGGWSAAEYWDFTEQIFRDVCVLTARPFRKKRETVEGSAFVLNRMQERHIFGTRTVWEEQVRIQVSDPHRTILDMLVRPVVGGGLRHLADCLLAYLDSPEADLKKLFEYGDRLGNGAAFKRLGFLLERASTSDGWALDACQKRMTAGHAKLDPALPADALVSRWRIWVPASWQMEASRD